MAYIGHSPSTGEDNNFKILDDISSYTLTFDGSSSSIVSASDDTIYSYDHRFITGQRVTYNHGGGANINGLSSGSVYFIIKQDHNNIKLATTAARAISGTSISLSLTGTSGSSHTLNVAFDGVNTKFKATHTTGKKARITRAAQLVLSVNGVIQQPHDSSSPSTGFGFDLDGTIVFSQAPASTDAFWGHILTNNNVTFDISDNTVDHFSGDGSTVAFTLSKSPANNENILVTIDGVVQYPNDSAGNIRSYSVAANVISFTTAPGSGTQIEVRHIGFAGSTSAPVTGFYGRTGNAVLKSTDNITVNDAAITGDATITGDLTVNGTTTTLDTKLTEVDQILVGANNSTVAVAVTQSGSGDIITGFDGSTEVFSVAENGGVGIADSIYHIGDDNTAIRFPSADTFRVDTGGTERFRITSVGGVGIGTQVPYVNTAFNSLSIGGSGKTGLLELNQASGTAGARIDTYGDGTNGHLRITTAGTSNDIQFITGGTFTEKVRITSGGAVGINSSSPSTAQDLTFDGASNYKAGILYKQAGVNQYRFMCEGGTGHVYYDTFVDGGDHVFRTDAQSTGGSEKLRITEEGNVGINTATPGAQLEVKGSGSSNTLNFLTKDVNRNTVFYAKDGGQVGLHYYPFVINQDTTDSATPSSTFFYVHHASSPFIIKSDGKVGVGENTPTSLLHLKRSSTTAYSSSATNNDNTLMLINEGAAGHTSIQFQTVSGGTANTGQANINVFCEGASAKNTAIAFGTRGSSGNPAERLRIDSSGRIGVGTTDPGIYSNLADKLVLRTTGNTGITLRSGNTSGGSILFASADNNTSNEGIFQYKHNDKAFEFNNYGGGNEKFVYKIQGNEKFRIDSTGAVGINSTSPTANYKLDVNGDLTLGEWKGVSNTYIDQKQDGDLHLINSGRTANGASGSPGTAGVGINRFNNISGGTSLFRDFAVYNGKDSKVLVVDGSASSVGIGTDAPAGTLEIDAASSTQMIMLDSSGTNFARIGYNSASGTAILDLRSEGHVRFLTNGNNERLRIKTDGTLSINNSNAVAGTAGTVAQLKINSDGQYDGIMLGNVYTYGTISRGTGGESSSIMYTANAGAANLGGGVKRAHEWWSGSSGGGQPNFRMALTAAGRLGIGVTNPDYMLHLSGSVPATCFEDTDGTHGQAIIEQNGDNLKIRQDAGNASSGTGSNISLEVDSFQKMKIHGNYAGTIDVKGIPAHLRLYSQRDTSDWDADDEIGKIEFHVGDDATNNLPYTTNFIKSVNTVNDKNEPDGALVFGSCRHNQSGGAQETMRLTHDQDYDDRAHLQTKGIGAIRDVFDMMNINMAGNAFDSITNNSDGGGTTWEPQNGTIRLYNTSGGHGGNWGKEVLLREDGYYYWRMCLRLTTTCTSIHGSTSTNNYKYPIGFRFHMGGSGAANSCTIRLWNEFATEGTCNGSQTGTGSLTDGTRVVKTGVPIYLTKGVYQPIYHTNGYQGVRELNILSLELVMCGATTHGYSNNGTY